MSNQNDMAKEAFTHFLAVAQAQTAMRHIPLPDMEESSREYIRSLMEERAKKLDPVIKYLLRISNNVVLNVRDE